MSEGLGLSRPDDTVWALRSETDAKHAALEGQLTRRIETLHRELEAQKAYFDALRTTDQRALDMASEERTKAAEVLEREREKSASALREGTNRSIAEGTERMREHVNNQLQQVRGDLVSADKLEIARISAVGDGLTQAIAAAEKAVEKAEASNSKRFEDANEWREQSADRERTQAEERVKLEASFMRKEVAETYLEQIRVSSDQRFEQQRQDYDSLAARVDVNQGEIAGQRRAISDRHQGVSSTTAILLSLVGFVTVVLMLLNVVAVLTHGFH